MTSDELIKKITEKIFRSYYVPLYPKDKPISEMTSTEQGMYKETLNITTMAFFGLKSLENEPGRPSRRLKGIGDYCVEAGLCKGIEMRASELFLIEDHKRLRLYKSRFDAEKLKKLIIKYGIKRYQKETKTILIVFSSKRLNELISAIISF